jgi:hypothetical protein
MAFRREINRFMNRGVLSGFGDEKLVQAQAQEIAKIDIYALGPKFADPKIEQRQVSQNAIKQLERECAIGRLELRFRKELGDDRIGEAPSCSPGFQRDDSVPAS